MNLDIADAAPELTVPKGKFAELIGVSPGRVSQYIADGKIDGDALDGDGRNAKIRVAVACAQLKRRLNVDQRFGANGIGTRLDIEPLQPAPRAVAPAAPDQPATLQATQAPAPPPLRPASLDDQLDAQIKRNRLEQLERANRKEAEEEAARTGRFSETEAVRQQMGRIAAQIVGVFEGALADFATAIAAEFKVPQRDVLHALRGEFRNVRARAAELYRASADNLPAIVEVEIADRPPVEPSAPTDAPTA